RAGGRSAARGRLPQGGLHTFPPFEGDAVQPDPRSAAVTDGRAQVNQMSLSLASNAGEYPDAGWKLRVEEGRALLRLAAPIALIALVNMGMSVTDTVMVSVIFGTGALAAVAVGSDLYSIVFYLCAGVLGGIAPFYTAAVIRRSPDERVRLERIGW